MRFHSLLIIVLSFMCFSCACKVDKAVTNTDKTVTIPALKCFASPPVQDKGKIAKMLERNGTITSDMSVDEVNKVVSDYIKRKNQSFKDCKK